MAIPHSTLRELNLAQQKVFLRADLNVPLSNGTIVNDYRLATIIPTIDLILQKEGKIILATHLGRPKGSTPSLSTKILLPWFIEKGYNIRFESDLNNISFEGPDANIILLENLRFYPGEQQHDPAFAQQLFSLADYYVNDAFAVLHRTDTSVTLLPALFPLAKKTFGLLAEQEFKALSPIKEHPEQPFIVICGGGKVRDKLPLLQAMLNKAKKILLCPALVFTFLKAQGISTGKSLVDPDSLASVKNLITEADSQGTALVFPLDYQVALNSLEGPLEEVTPETFPENGVGMSIGTKTQKLFADEIHEAKTVFFNGLPGLWERPETLEGAHALLKAMAESDAYTVLGGGDSVALAEQLGLAHRMSYCSTGGGATLAYIAGEELPGLVAMR